MADQTPTTNLSANPIAIQYRNPVENPAADHITNRRQLLAGGSALALSGVALTEAAVPDGTLISDISPAPDDFLSSGPAAPAPDPAYVAYRRAQEAEDTINRYQGPANEYYAGLAVAYLDAREVLAATSSSSVKGIHSKVMWFAEAQDWRVGDSFFDSLLGLSILRDLEGMMAKASFAKTGGVS